MNFDFKNGCKNEFEENKEKYYSRFKNRVPHKIDFRADWTYESNPTAWELNLLLIEFTIGQLIQVLLPVLQYLQEGLDYSRDTRGPDFPIFIQKNNAMIRDSRIS